MYVDYNTNNSPSPYCPNCGKPYWGMYPSTGGKCQCSLVTPSVSPSTPTGWVCPACGCGNAGWSSKCGHCVPKFEGTTGSTKELGAGGRWLQKGVE